MKRFFQRFVALLFVLCAVSSLYAQKSAYRESWHENGKVGIETRNGKQVIPPQYDSVAVVFRKTFLLAKEDKWFLINKNGESLVEDGFSQLWFPEMYYADDIFWAKTAGKWHIWGANGSTINPFAFDTMLYMSPFEETRLVPMLSEGKYAVLSAFDPRVLIQGVDSVWVIVVEQSNNKPVLIFEQSGSLGALHLNGMHLLPAEYEEIGLPEEDYCASGLLPVKKDGYRGYADFTGRILLPCAFDSAYSPDSDCLFDGFDYVVVVRADKRALFHRDRQLICAFDFDEILRVDKEVFSVVKDSKYGLMNGMGKLIHPCIYDELEYSSRYTSFYRDNRGGYFDKKGNEVLD